MSSFVPFSLGFYLPHPFRATPFQNSIKTSVGRNSQYCWVGHSFPFAHETFFCWILLVVWKTLHPNVLSFLLLFCLCISFPGIVYLSHLSLIITHQFDFLFQRPFITSSLSLLYQHFVCIRILFSAFNLPQSSIIARRTYPITSFRTLTC